MKPLNFIIIKITLCFVLGIVLENWFDFSINDCLTVTATLLITIAIIYFLVKNHFKQRNFFGIIVFLVAMAMGSLTYKLHDETLQASHYNHLKFQDSIPYTFSIQIKERLKPSKYHEKYIAEILEIDSNKVTGKALLNMTKDSTSRDYHTDDIIVGHSSLKTINRPFNPYQFDYRAYLEKQQIYDQLFFENNQHLLVQSKPVSIEGYADRLRNYINTELGKYPFSETQLAFINALFLGQRQDIDSQTQQNYTNAGVVHILAISGLHIGIILMILQVVFKPIERIKYGVFIKTFCIVLLLWGFAFIAGLSASVVRAVTMFTVVAIALNLKRPHNVYNTIAISILCILIFKPQFLFEVGFQLSYLAVLGIVSFQPIIYKIIYRPKSWILNKAWETMTVTLAAQIGILPLSLYYFHSFPLLFLLSNLVIVPLLGLLLVFGFLVILLAISNALPDILVLAFGMVISTLNRFVAWIAHFESYILKNISFGALELAASYITILFLLILFNKRSGKRIIAFLMSLVVFQLTFIYKRELSKTHEFIVFHKSKHSLIGVIENKRATFYHNVDSLGKERIVSDYTMGSYIENIVEDSLKYVYKFNDKIILQIDSVGIYQLKSHKPDIILLTDSPKINLERLIDSLNPEQIIADGSNYKSYIERWKATCLKREIPFHNTNEKGAFILK